MKVGVVGNPRYRDLKAVLEHVAQIAPAKGITLYCEERLGPFWSRQLPVLEQAELDALVTFGGDGTLLRGARVLNGRETPILGVNLGRVGFLTTATRETLDHALDALVAGRYITERRQALTAAIRRGVRVRIIVPGHNTDTALVRSAGRATWGPFLQAGAQIHEYQPTMFHCKVLVVDGLWVSVGSTNFDTRSFRLNDEANLNVLDRDFAERQTSDFENDLKRSRRVTYEQWRERPWTEKLWESTAGLFRSQL